MGISKPPTYHSYLKWEISWPDIVVAKEITGDNDFAAMRIADLYRFFETRLPIGGSERRAICESAGIGRQDSLKNC